MTRSSPEDDVDLGIGCKDFAEMVGAHWTNVSQCSKAGVLRIVAKGKNKRGPGSSMLDRRQAERIAAAVRCGLPWQLAARIDERISVIDGGVIISEGPTK